MHLFAQGKVIGELLSLADGFDWHERAQPRCHGMDQKRGCRKHSLIITVDIVVILPLSSSLLEFAA
jgi:hypothetical protein